MRIPDMLITQNLTILVLLVFFLSTASSQDSFQIGDTFREARLIEELEANLFDGEIVELKIDNRIAVAVYTKSQTNKDNGVILLLHGRGLHPDWPDNIGPLRIGLTEHGWNTLSLQLPVQKQNAKYLDYVPIFPEASKRITSSIAYLKKRGFSKIILLAHSCGAHMAFHYLEHQGGDNNVDAFIGIGMGATDYKQDMINSFPFAQLTIPILDIYSSNDYPAVIRLAPKRLESIKLGNNSSSKQIMLPYDDHFFTNNSALLSDNIISWLSKLPFNKY